MSYNAADWPTVDGFPAREPARSTGDENETARQPQGEPAPWSWGLQSPSSTAYGLGGTAPTGAASASDFPTGTSSSSLPPAPFDLSSFTIDHGVPPSYWNTDSTANGAFPEPLSGGAGGGGGNGVSLSMLEADADGTNGLRQPSDEQQNPPSVDTSIRVGTLDSGLASSATHLHKHSRPSSAEIDGDGLSSTSYWPGASGTGERKMPRKDSEQSDGARSASGSGSGDLAGQVSGLGNGEGAKKIVKRSDKSCKKCRCVFSLFFPLPFSRLGDSDVQCVQGAPSSLRPSMANLRSVSETSRDLRMG
jgi:hypothetical protein